MRLRSSIIVVVVAVVTTLFHVASCKELVLTNEWTIVGENDTLPAGAHIRMDMTTGEKMAKLLQKEDADDERLVEITADGTAAAALEIVPDATSAAATVGEKTDTTDSFQQKIQEAKERYDYDMMYRTLSKLPAEEQERMGLPELPSGNGAGMTKQEREAFEQKMKKIWGQRQEEIARLQLEMQMDMPELLKDRIARLKLYLADPTTHLLELQENRDDVGREVEEGIVTNIESVLVDLEYQLSDLDMTRDFHTLGGWHLLVSMLDDSVHQTNANHTNLEMVARVQLYAAWTIGTAVKNTAEFNPYAIETVLVNGKETTAISLLVDQLHTNNDSKLRHKLVYALGSMLRGNRAAQLHFLQIDGSQSLSRTLNHILKNGEDTGLAKRILALTGDIVADVVLHDDGHHDIVSAFSTTQFCQSALDSLELTALRETSVRAIQSMAPFCDWDSEKVVTALAQVKRSWQGEPDIDPQVRREMLDLVGNVIERVKEKK